MRKFFVIILICIILLISYIFIISILNYGKDMYSVTVNVFNSAATEGTFTFKSSPENKNLLYSALKLNLKFINNPPDEYKAPEEIQDFYKLQTFFKQFTSYYEVKKLSNHAIYNEIPDFLSKVKSDPQSFFDNNGDYISETFGINNYEKFLSFYNTMLPIKDTDILSCKLEDSYFYNSDSISGRFIITLKDNQEIYLGFNLLFTFNKNTKQYTPDLQFYSPDGGVS